MMSFISAARAQRRHKASASDRSGTGSIAAKASMAGTSSITRIAWIS
jgi:hypothetical protein